MEAFVYVVTNPAMPGLAKIGISEDPSKRVHGLFTTEVPLPFEVECLLQVNDKDRASEIEKALHQAFAPERVHPRREFFRTDPERVRPLLALHGEVHRGPLVAEDPTDEDEHAVGRHRGKRPVLNFDAMGVPRGAELQGARELTAKVVSGRKVVYDGEEMFLTKATLLDRGFQTARGPCPYWSWDNRLLSEIYEETYGPAMLPGDDEPSQDEEG